MPAEGTHVVTFAGRRSDSLRSSSSRVNLSAGSTVRGTRQEPFFTMDVAGAFRGVRCGSGSSRSLLGRSGSEWDILLHLC